MSVGKVLASANLGKTTYEVREDHGANVVIVRVNGDGEHTFYVPRSLFDEYAARAAGQVLSALVRGARS